MAVICSLPCSLLAAADRFAVGDALRVEVERHKRFAERTLGDLVAFRQFAEEDISELERQRAAIALLEAPQREDDLNDLLDWYYRYYDWLMGEEEAAEAELARLSAPGAVPDMSEGHFKAMADKVSALSQQLNETVKGFVDRGNRLAAIIDRRRLLQEQFNDLEAQLARLGRGEPEQQRRPPRKGRRDASQLQADIRIVQTELLSLPDIDEDILKHFAVLIEQGKWEVEWLDLLVQEYDALHDVAALLPADDMDATAQGYRRLIRSYNRMIGRFARLSGELERKDSRLSPAGTIREMERTRDLIDLYDRLRYRFDRRTEQLKVRVGAWEAEMAELDSRRRP
jgi:hypothetical protein